MTSDLDLYRTAAGPPAVWVACETVASADKRDLAICGSVLLLAINGPARSDTLMSIIERKVVPDRIVYSNGWVDYNVPNMVAMDLKTIWEMSVNAF